MSALTAFFSVLNLCRHDLDVLSYWFQNIKTIRRDLITSLFTRWRPYEVVLDLPSSHGSVVCLDVNPRLSESEPVYLDYRKNYKKRLLTVPVGR